MACPATSAKGVLAAIDKVIARARTKPLRGGRRDLDALRRRHRDPLPRGPDPAQERGALYSLSAFTM
ncbi:hypothetical protein [Streptosporangium sp. NPDC002524]|uniref:hypothetical protein n=1 Tax=Streptosporangium sp. NPDC002524 TaxID=3154537 RepID=UPI0033213690